MMGILFYEFVNGIYIEMKKIFKDKKLHENKIDRLIEACKNIADNICGKVKEIGEALVDGGIQGFLSNFITYAINLIWTTSARIVKIIRESMSAFWKAVKVWWIDDSTPTEKARKIIKIIISVISIELGVMLHETVKTFIMSIPIFLPIAEELSGAITAIITGIMTAIAIYGIDSFFDWINSTGTEKLEEKIELLNDNVDVANYMMLNLDSQFKNSQKYTSCKKGYECIEQYMKNSLNSLEKTSQSYCKINNDNKKMIDFMSDSIKKELEFEKQLKDLGIEV